MKKEKPKRKTSNNYWINRALKREKEAYLTGNELNKKMFEFYENASNDIRKQINDFYSRYASENGLTFDEAMIELNKSEYREWKKSLDEYVREYETEADPIRAAELKARVDARAYRSRITRLEAVSTQIEGAVNGLYFGAVTAMSNDFAKVFEKSFMGKAEDLAERFDIDIGFAQKYFNEKMVKDVISYPWCGNHFSDRLWKNKENLIFNLRDILSRGLQSGTGLPQMAKEMADKTGQSFKAAYNLVESETTHFHEEANFRAYEAAGIEQYQFWSEHELLVCGECAALDMKVFNVKDRKEGVNAPPMHNHCRCVTVEYDPYEKEDYINSGIEPPDDRQTWKEWYDGEVARRGKDAVENEIKMRKNKAADEKQFEKYKNIFKDDFPKTFEEFQDLKYNRVEEWNNFKNNKQERLNSLDYSQMRGLKKSLSNKEARIWYKTHDENIPDLIDKSKPIEVQARQACDLRNKYRTQTRELMADQEERKRLDIDEPNKSFDELIADKMTRKKLSREEAIVDIYKTATKTNTGVNKSLGLE